jgi:hypothetical protein
MGDSGDEPRDPGTEAIRCLVLFDDVLLRPVKGEIDAVLLLATQPVKRQDPEGFQSHDEGIANGGFRVDHGLAKSCHTPSLLLPSRRNLEMHTHHPAPQ